MFRDKKIMIAIIIVLLICIAGLGIAFAAFSQTLTIGGAAEVESSSWSVVFEGLTNPNTIDAPVLTGTAQEITHPTIKNNSSEISTFEATLKTPGDSIIYNFKIHNKGDFAANLDELHIGDRSNKTKYYHTDYPASGYYIVKDKDKYYANSKPYNKVNYIFYYTADNSLVGSNPAKDCLEPGETVFVSLKLVFSSIDETDPSVLPSTDLIFDNLGISATYLQSNNGSCESEMINNYSGAFINYDQAYYSYEDKTFKGTGVNNTIITEYIIGLSQYSTEDGTDNGEGANPRYTLVDTPAKDMAAAYCTGCTLMTGEEYNSWCPNRSSNKCTGYYNGGNIGWWLNDEFSYYHGVLNGVASGFAPVGQWMGVTATNGVRPVVSIPSTATMSGSGTQLDPYVITTN